ncbi:MAG TPA: TMEM175 family protein [Bacteroidota bacterium]|nr:TMEM175 family protein [Bacteroidota bacterium]
MKIYNQIAGLRIQRIEAISDGVFAIALTLLVLDIKVPLYNLAGSEVALMQVLWNLAPSLVSYFLSFMTLGIYWSAHATQFHYIAKSDRHLTWINLFFLLFVSTIPFTTAFLSHFIAYKFAIGIYWLNIFILGGILALHWQYADKHRFVSLDEQDIVPVRNAIKKRIIEAQTLYTLGALLCFISTSLSIIVLVLIQLNFALALVPRRRNPHSSAANIQ